MTGKDYKTQRRKRNVSKHNIFCNKFYVSLVVELSLVLSRDPSLHHFIIETFTIRCLHYYILLQKFCEKIVALVYFILFLERILQFITSTFNNNFLLSIKILICFFFLERKMRVFMVILYPRTGRRLESINDRVGNQPH